MTRFPDYRPDGARDGGFRRRHLLGMAGGVAAAATLGGAAVASPAVAGPGGPYGFALLGDTQVDVDVPDRTVWVRWVYESIAAAGPPVVCHVGDIVEHGSEAEYRDYLGTIPAALRPRIRHVPGNHEVRWDPTAGDRYRSLFGPARYSFDAGGMHFVGLDPMNLLQEPGHFGGSGLAWLKRDLDRVPAGVPIVLMSHFPFGVDNYYVSDQDRLLSLLEPYNVRVIFAGHIHAEQVHRFNGMTQFCVKDTRGAPVYYWVEKTVADSGPVLRIWQVSRGADGVEVRREAATIPLAGDGEGRRRRAKSVHLDAAAGALGVTVSLGGDTDASGVRAQLYPQHRFGGKEVGDWRDLTATAGHRFAGSLDISTLPAGVHRMTVRVTGDDGAWHQQTHTFTTGGGAARREAWRRTLDGPAQAGLTHHGRLLVAASTHGHVLAAQVGARDADPVWQARVGPVVGRPAFSADGATVFVGSADRNLYAFDARTGRRRFAYRTDGSVLGGPLVTRVADREVVFASAGDDRYAVDAATGDTLWRTAAPGFFAGRMACDGERVYAGAGDGRVYAYDAATGTAGWSFSTTTRTTAYSRLIYGPWADTIELLPDGAVLVSTVASAFALDGATGTQRWTLAGSYIYAPAVLLDGGADVLLIDEWGVVSRVASATGAVQWRTELGVRVMNSGAAVHDGVAWVMGTTGLLAGVDLATGAVLERFQLTSAYSHATPVVVGSTLVVADQDGVVRGINLD